MQKQTQTSEAMHNKCAMAGQIYSPGFEELKKVANS